MIEGPNGDLRYLQLGARICMWCYDKDKVFESVYLHMESTKALRREVRVCDRCGLIGIGERIPLKLEQFFRDNPEDDDLPKEERVGV